MQLYSLLCGNLSVRCDSELRSCTLCSHRCSHRWYELRNARTYTYGVEHA